MFVDVLMAGTPIRLLHFIHTVLLGSVYSLFNAIYFLNDGTITEGRYYAYNLLDWSKPTKAIVTCALCVVLCVFAQVLLYGVYRIRMCIYTKVYFGSDIAKSDSEMQRIMGESVAPMYQTVPEKDESNLENVFNQVESDLSHSDPH